MSSNFISKLVQMFHYVSKLLVSFYQNRISTMWEHVTCFFKIVLIQIKVLSLKTYHHFTWCCREFCYIL